MASLLEIDVSNVGRLASKLDALNTSFTPARVMDLSSAVLINNIRTRFLDQIDPDGQKWPESKAAIARRKSGRGGGTLFDTGALFHSLQPYKTTGIERSIGTDIPYAPKNQKERVFLGFGRSDEVAIEGLLLNIARRALDG